MIKKIIFFIFIILSILTLNAQDIKVLFIGNSYTSVNNLPDLFYNVSISTGDHVQVYSNTPGGCTFQLHCSNQSATMIQQGGWDYVVLQEQSQLPSFPISQVQTDCFPYATQLNQMIEQSNPCGETVFYMTWGRKYGDQDNANYFPPLATYEGMDSLLFERYMQMTQDNNAIVSPVGRVWRYLRTYNPEIELYSTDNSHPSVAGSYAAACTFYTTILRKDPTNIAYDAVLDHNTSQIIRNAVKTIVFDTLSTWFIGERNLIADFSYDDVTGFTNLSQNTNSTTNYSWTLGNGETSTETNPIPNYIQNGIYTVILTATDECGQESMIEKTIEVNRVSINNINQFASIYPNPVSQYLNIETKNLQGPFFFNISDINGKIVFKEKMQQNKITIDLSFLLPGIYFIKISNNRYINYSKFIKYDFISF